MELIPLGINNIDQFKKHSIEKNASRNYTEFTRAVTILDELGSNEKMLTNIDNMRVKLGGLLEKGLVETESFEYQQLISAIDQAVKIQFKTKKSLDDIADFYNTYNNFGDISKRAGEGK